jgi:hypothetical protein
MKSCFMYTDEWADGHTDFIRPFEGMQMKCVRDNHTVKSLVVDCDESSPSNSDAVSPS